MPRCAAFTFEKRWAAGVIATVIIDDRRYDLAISAQSDTTSTTIRGEGTARRRWAREATSKTPQVPENAMGSSPNSRNDFRRKR
jgi:hypothetical protein